MNLYPTWLDATAAGRRLKAFLYRNDAFVQGRIVGDVVIDDFFPPEKASRFEFSAFAAPKDSLFYSRLLERVIEGRGRRGRFIDLCTGSALPFLGALARVEAKETSRSASPVHARLIDVDPAAAAIARANVHALGARARIDVETGCFHEFFRTFGGGADEIVCLNPPYLPYASASVPAEYFPVAAGPDGLAFLRPALEADYHPTARLVIEWSSLADPVAVIDLIERRFEVELCVAQEIAFGRYTTQGPIRAELDRQAATDRALFDSGPTGAQILIGSVLRPRRRSRSIIGGSAVDSP